MRRSWWWCGLGLCFGCGDAAERDELTGRVGGAPGGDDGRALSVGPMPGGDEAWSAPRHALVEVIDERAEQRPSIVANSGFATTYVRAIDVVAGDVLRIHAQTEVTNDYVDPVNGTVRVVVDGVPVGATASQNVIAQGSHHMPLRTDAQWVAPADGSAVVEVQYAAARSDASPAVTVEAGYGGAVIEHYRAFASPEAVVAAGARGLAGVTVATDEISATFGGYWATHAVAYAATVDARAGDELIVRGQSTSGYATAHEMHGHGLFAGGAQLAPWSTENTPWAVNQVPLASAAALSVAADGPIAFEVTMHGVAGVGGNVVAGGGHVAVARFRAWEPGIALLDGWSEVAGASTSITANAGALVVSEAPVELSAGDTVRASATAQLGYPTGFTLGISCSQRTELVAPDGSLRATSSRSSKYLIAAMEVMPLTTLLLAQADEPGLHHVRTTLECLRQDASPVVSIAHAGALLEVFRVAP